MIVDLMEGRAHVYNQAGGRVYELEMRYAWR